MAKLMFETAVRNFRLVPAIAKVFTRVAPQYPCHYTLVHLTWLACYDYVRDPSTLLHS